MARTTTNPIAVRMPTVSVAMRARLEARFARMQSPQAVEAMRRAFEASPEQLGEAAVAAVRRRRDR
jgi:hypothetical protein